MPGLGVFGGTFDPVHCGHLLAAQEAMEACGFDEILFVPNKVPPHKQRSAGSAGEEDRFLMLCLAAASNPAFHVSRLELERPEVSYTVDTMRQLQAMEPARPLFFITGVDALLNYAWKDFDGLLAVLAGLVVMTRPGFSADELRARLQGMGLKDIEKIRFVTMPEMGISSTLVRERLHRGGSVRYLVPPAVEDYLRKNRLYV